MKKIDDEIRNELKQIVLEAFKEAGVTPQDDIWVNSERAMRILNCKKTQLYLLCQDEDNGIVVSQKNRKNKVYLKSSLYAYLEKNIKK